MKWPGADEIISPKVEFAEVDIQDPRDAPLVSHIIQSIFRGLAKRFSHSFFWQRKYKDPLKIVQDPSVFPHLLTMIGPELTMRVLCWFQWWRILPLLSRHGVMHSNYDLLDPERFFTTPLESLFDILEEYHRALDGCAYAITDELDMIERNPDLFAAPKFQPRQSKLKAPSEDYQGTWAAYWAN